MTAFDDRPTEASLTTGVRSSDEAVAVTPHHLASHAALEIMRTGGNAVDAAIAANAMQGVVAPDTCGIGGDLFALIHTPGGATPLALNASGRAGSGITSNELRDDHTEIPRRHVATITTPGCVDGWITLAETAGALPLGVSLAPAIAAATDGFPVSQELAASLRRLRDMIGSQDSSRTLYPNGTPPIAGQVIVRPRLAETLAGVATANRDSFYGGDVGNAIVAATGGIITREDLERQNAEWIDPIGMEVLGHRAWTTPPNTQGYLTLAAAWLFEQLEQTRDPANPAFMHAAIEAYRAVAWERDNLVSDPETAPLEPKELLNPDRLAPLLSTVSMEHAGSYPQPRPAPGGTAFMCVRDRNGMGISLIQSNFWGIGSGRSAGDTGVFLHNRGAGFNLIPGHPNEYQPGRRPLHTLSPTLWTQQGGLSMLLGTRGGQFQPQLLVQMIAAMLHGGMSPAAAQHAARWQVEGWKTGDEPVVRVERRMDRGLTGGLETLGHRVIQAADWEAGWGPVSVITESDALVLGAADPRVSTSAAL